MGLGEHLVQYVRFGYCSANCNMRHVIFSQNSNSSRHPTIFFMSSDHLDFLILLHVSTIFPAVTTKRTGYNEVNAFFLEYHPQRQLPVQTPCGFEIHTSLKKSSQLLLLYKVMSCLSPMVPCNANMLFGNDVTIIDLTCIRYTFQE